MAEQLWKGRFSKAVDSRVNDFNSSIRFDQRMIAQDMRGSGVHAAMLAKQGIISEKDCEDILSGLASIADDLASGALEIDPNAEDVHTFVEQTLTARIGDAGKRLHTGRSRNDQVALDIRMYTKKEIIEQNKNNEIAPENIDLGKTANAWGESMDSLEKIFSRKSVNYNIGQDGKGKVINFEKAFLGEKADFVYLDFGNLDMNYKYTLYNLNGEVEQQKNKYTNDLMKKDYNSGMSVRISWKDENNESHLIMCNMSKGKLLIPVGAGAKWLFNKHSDISIHVFQDDVEVATPNINEIKFLKLREVN